MFERRAAKLPDDVNAVVQAVPIVIAMALVNVVVDNVVAGNEDRALRHRECGLKKNPAGSLPRKIHKNWQSINLWRGKSSVDFLLSRNGTSLQ